MAEKFTNIPPIPEQENALKDLQEVIRTAPEKIEKEFAQGQNPWSFCFNHAAVSVELFFIKKEIKGLLSLEQYERAQKGLENLRARSEDVATRYPDIADDISPELKQELIEALDILKE